MKYKDTWITQDAFYADIHKYLNEDEQFNKVFGELENGIYIFGHSHIQWNFQSDSGKKILINPGSCGLPLDCINVGLPYTILDITDNNIVVEEKRVPFDMNKYIETIQLSDQFTKAKVWSKVVIKELKTRREYMFFFLRFVEKYALEIGDGQRPFSVSTWEKAYELWENSFKDGKLYHK
jgi:hypothetical protein